MNKELVDILNRLDFLDQRFLVGGCVRDALVGRPWKDVDVSTPIQPPIVQALAEASGFTVVPTGIKHGTVTIMGGGLPKHGVEVTTFRRDINQSGRKTDVMFTTSVIEDLARRDFTMNAMAMDTHGTVLDPFKGSTDLAAGILHTVGKPSDRFQEDYLRVVRAVRFAADYNLKYAKNINLSQELFIAAPFVKDNVSVERFVMEVNKAWAGENPGMFIKQLYLLGILQDLIPELQGIANLRQDPRFHPEGSVLNHVAIVVKNAHPRYRWHALLHDVGKSVVKTPVPGYDYFTYGGHAEAGAGMIPTIAKRLKMPTWLKDELVATTLLHMRPLDMWRQGERDIKDKTIRRFQAAAGEYLTAVEAVVRADRMARGGPNDEYLDRLFIVKEEDVRSQPVVMGRHLIEAGYQPGPEFTTILKWCEEYHLEAGETDAMKIILEYARSETDEALDKLDKLLEPKEVVAV